MEGLVTIGTFVFGYCDSPFRSRRVTLVGMTDHSPVIDKSAATSTVGMDGKRLPPARGRFLWQVLRG